MSLRVGVGRSAFGPIAVQPPVFPYTMSPAAVWPVWDLSKLWQDDEGTVPAAADSPVGLIQDPANGHDLYQGTAAACAILRAEGGLYWLEFDGVDDFYFCDTAPLGTSTSSLVALGVRFDAISGEQVTFYSVSVDGTITLNPNMSTNGTDFRFIRRGGDGSISVPTKTVAAATTYVAVGHGTAASSYLRLNGVNGAENTAAQADYAAPTVTRFGATDNSGVPSSFFGGRWYGGIALDRAALSEEIKETDEFMAEKSGVTL